jgi:hypothetical protein
MTPFPGSELYDRAAEFGTFADNWEHMNLLNAVFVPYGLTREDLEHAQNELLKRFYLRPQIFFDYVMRLLQRPSLIKGFWSGFRSLMRSISAA